MICEPVNGVNEFEVEWVPIDTLRPSPENDDIYNRIDKKRQDFRDLVESVRDHGGIREPIIITADDWIVSGHRRFAASRECGHDTVPVRKLDVHRADVSDAEYRALLTDYNTQRQKTAGERFRESLARTKPLQHSQIIAERLAEKPVCGGALVETDGAIRRHGIGPNKREFVDAVLTVLRDNHLPMSIRAIHYKLLDIQPMTNASKGKQRHKYANDATSSRKLSDLVTRMRINGTIPMNAIIDETRPVITWDVDSSVDGYTSKVMARFSSRYFRDLTIDQPNHIEIIAEKLTIKRAVQEVAMRYTIPVTIARGKCSLPPRAQVVSRYKTSGKDRLVLIMLADHDPDGVVITDLWHKSLIGDFGLDPSDIIAVRAGINADHAEEFNLPCSIDAKPTSPTYKDFVRNYGTDAYELDALSHDQLRSVLTNAIESQIDRDAYESQVQQEEKEAAFLETMRVEVGDFIGELMEGSDLE